MDRNDLFKKLFEGCNGYIELRAIKEGGITKQCFISLDGSWQSIGEEVDKFCEKYKNRNLYFGLSTRDGKGGAGENVVSIQCVWAEIDFKNIKEDKVKGVLDCFPLKPSIVVNSGGGLHLYFLLDKPVDLTIGSEFRGTDVRKVNDWIRLELNKLGECALDDIGDIPRIIRLPNTKNHKYPDKPLCEIIEINDYTYSFVDLLEKIPVSVGASMVDTYKKPLKELYSGSKEGSRNTDMTRLIGSWVSDGLGFDECLEIARAVNSKNNPPLPEKEVEAVIKSILKKHGIVSHTTSTTLNLTDIGNSQRLVMRHGDIIRYCYPRKKWLVWDENCGIWQIDNDGRILRLAKQTVKNIYNEAAAIKDEEKRKHVASWAVKSESVQHLQGMIKLTESEENIPILQNQLDIDPWLLNCSNGTIDLRTGELKSHDKNDLITKIIPVEYNPGADCPIWIDFLEKIMNWNHDLIPFLQRAIGYSLTGDTSEQCLFLLYGVGANGKSTFLNVISVLLGDYAQTASFDSFLIKKYNTNSNDVARMQGRRFISAVEAEGERRLAEVLIKQLTGGDTITARFLFGEFFEFQPQFKLWLAANHKPTIKGTDHAIWRRIKLIPFDITIPDEEQDKKLIEKLKGELSGILTWAVQGCLDWQREELQTPDDVKAATNDYRNEMDEIGIFLTDCCILSPNARTNPTNLYDAYKKWCEDTGETVLSQRAFLTRLTERGLKPKQSGGQRYRSGVELLEKRTACTA